MYGPGSSKKNGVGGLKRKLPFLNVHNNWQKKGGGVVTHLVSSLKYHCLPMVPPILLPLLLFFSLSI